MAQDFILMIANQAIWVALLVAGPPAIASLFVGLAIAIFQAVTQIQEQSLTFIPKVIVVFGTLAVLGSAMGGTMVAFGRVCFEGFALVVGR